MARLQDRDGSTQLVGDVGDEVAADLFLPVQGPAIWSKDAASSRNSPGAWISPTRAARSPAAMARVAAISRVNRPGDPPGYGEPGEQREQGGQTRGPGDGPQQRGL